jgi:hypothetical protein
MMQLRELQRALQGELFGAHSGIAAAIIEHPPLPVESRLGIYRNAYRTRLTEALAGTYTVLHDLLGDETFEALADVFIAAHPSQHRSIRWYGSELADVLSSTAPFDAQPIFAEVARFEWALCEVFDSADTTPLGREALLQIDPENWSKLGFTFHPSLRRLTFEWNTVAVWKSMGAGVDPPAPERSAEPVEWLLWRQSLENYFRSIDAAESAALTAALQGATFEAICAELAGQMSEDEVPLRAASLVGGWLDSGAVTALSLES